MNALFQAMQWEEQKFPNGEKDYSSIVQVYLLQADYTLVN